MIGDMEGVVMVSPVLLFASVLILNCVTGFPRGDGWGGVCTVFI